MVKIQAFTNSNSFWRFDPSEHCPGSSNRMASEVSRVFECRVDSLVTSGEYRSMKSTALIKIGMTGFAVAGIFFIFPPLLMGFHAIGLHRFELIGSNPEFLKSLMLFFVLLTIRGWQLRYLRR